MMKVDVEAPKTLSAAIEMAVTDARRLDRTDYFPSAGEWHNAYVGRRSDKEPFVPVCKFCLAGAVIAGTLGISRTKTTDLKSLDFDYFSTEQTKITWRRVMCALDCARQGEWKVAWNQMYAKIEGITDPIPIELNDLQSPAASMFVGWDEMDKHLNSLDVILPKLREIEEKYGKVTQRDYITEERN